jgi:hypothetical protein
MLITLPIIPPEKIKDEENLLTFSLSQTRLNAVVIEL